MIFKLLARLQRAADGEGNDLPGDGTTEDYGDDFTPTDDGAPAGDDQGKRTGVGGADDDADDGADEGKPDGKGGEDKGALDAAAEGLTEGQGDDKKDTGTPRTGKGKFIPLDRHEKLLKKERAKREELESQLSQSRAGQEMAVTNDRLEKIEDDLVTMEQKYNELLGEGDTKGAADMMTKIRHKNAELNAITFQQREAEMTARAVEQARYKETVSRIEEAYPELDKDADEFDEDLLQDVADLTQTGISRGLPPSKALQRAVQRIMGADDSAQKRATTVTARVDEKEVAAQRKSEAVKRNIDASGRTPPATHRAGQGNDAAGGALTVKQAAELSDEDFAKLSEKDLSRLRGDTL